MNKKDSLHWKWSFTQILWSQKTWEFFWVPCCINFQLRFQGFSPPTFKGNAQGTRLINLHTTYGAIYWNLVRLAFSLIWLVDNYCCVVLTNGGHIHVPNYNLECLFLWREKDQNVHGERHSYRGFFFMSKTRTNNKTNPHKTMGPGFKLRPHCWEATTLTTAPILKNHMVHVYFTLPPSNYVLFCFCWKSQPVKPWQWYWWKQYSSRQHATVCFVSIRVC